MAFTCYNETMNPNRAECMTNTTQTRLIYKKAPIVEAVIDIRFDPLKSIEFSQFEGTIRHALPNDYSFDCLQNEYEFKLGVNTSEKTHQTRGLRFKSTDGGRILQLRPTGFSLSKLAPYDRWEPFIAESKRLFTIYHSTLPVKNIFRVAVRFINRFDLPGPSVDLSNYLKIFPQFPDGNNLTSLAMQVSFNQSNPDTTLIIREALAPPYKPNAISILFDIDLFHEMEKPYSEDLWSVLELLHIRKNEAFENAITEKMRQLIL